MNITEAAAKWGVSTNTVMSYVEKGLINNLSASKNQLILPDIPKPYIKRKGSDKNDQIYKHILKATNEKQYVDAYVLRIDEDAFARYMGELIREGMLSKDVADTSELFIRSYQMFSMFGAVPSNKAEKPEEAADMDVYRELKIGKLASVVLRGMLEEGAADEDELMLMQQSDYSKAIFNLNYPVLTRQNMSYDKTRYYIKPLIINGVEYRLCSQWFESEANNDRPYLLKWIEDHKNKRENVYK